ncbi:MAG: C25 family cysteine peptidase, partial [Thermoplasmatota archaeon]
MIPVLFVFAPGHGMTAQGSDQAKESIEHGIRDFREPDIQLTVIPEYYNVFPEGIKSGSPRLLIKDGSVAGGEQGEERPFLTRLLSIEGDIEDIDVRMTSPLSIGMSAAPFRVGGIIGETEPYDHPEFQGGIRRTSPSGFEITKLQERVDHGRIWTDHTLKLFPVSFHPKGTATLHQRVEIDCWTTQMEDGKEVFSIFNSTRPTGPVKYLIITHKNLAPYVQELAKWKSQKGVFAKVVTTEEIDDQYSLRDIQAEMRAYVQDMEAIYDLDYLLLVGDVDQVKTRNTKNLYPETMYGEPSTFATDGYFSCVSPGTSWNTDGDSNYVEDGELDDAVPDLAVGRIASNDGNVISGLIDTLISREKGFVWNSEMEKAIFIAGDPQNVEGYPPDTLDHFWETYASDVFSGRETLYYDGTGTLSFSANSFRDTVGDTYQAICYFSHGTQTGLPGLFSNSQVSSMHTTGPEGMIFTMACLTGYFDSSSTECFAEAITENSDRGALGYVGSSRLAVGAIDTVYEGDAPGLEEDYWRALKKANNGDLDPTVGDVYREALTHFSTSFYPFPTSYYYYSAQRTFLEYNLFGEPEAPLFLHEPQRLHLEFNVSSDNKTVWAKVTNDTGAPVENSSVTVFRYEELGVSGITNSTGEVVIDIPPSNGGIVNITASKTGELPINSTFQLPDELAPTALFRITPSEPDGFNDLYSSFPLVELMGDEPVDVNFTFQGQSSGWSRGSTSFFGKEGANSVTFRVRDMVGLVSEPVSFNFTVDTTPPAIGFNTTPESPDGFDGWFNTIPWISLNSSEEIIVAYYRIDNDPESQYTGPFSLINGVHTVIFRAFDIAGNMNTTEATFKVDVMKPYSTLSVSHEPDGENGFHVTRPTLIIKAFDENGGRSQYRWDEGNWSYAEGSIYPPVGTHYLEYRAVDGTGNLEEKVNFRWFRFDPDPPMMDIFVDPVEPNGLNGYYVTKPTVTTRINESEESGGDIYLVLTEPGKGFSWANDSTKVSGPLLIPEGNWMLNFMAKDEAG